jgi:hypothetical protein
MARPEKQGLDYFPFDIDFFEDEKIEAISGEFGIKGEIAIIRLLCAVYRNGYFARWNEMLKMKLLKHLPGVSSDLLEQILNRLIKWEFFDEYLFDSVKILTSKGIQIRFFQAAKRRKINEELPYLLVNVYNNPPREELLYTKTPQSKVKKSKVKKSIINTGSSNELPRETSQFHAENIDYSGLIDFFNKKTNGVFGFIRAPLSDKRKGMIRARIREHGKKTFCDAIIRACESNFLKGSGGRGFTANFDWIIKPTNFEKIISGNYDNNKDQRDNKNTGLTEDFARNIAEGVARAQFEKEQPDGER